MLKSIFTLMRGQAATAVERIADENALAILDQQMREATAGYERARRGLALATAQSQREDARIAGLETQIRDLETRVEAALTKGAETLAQEGAEAIAALERDRDASREAQARFAAEQARLRIVVDKLSRRLADLERGRRIAKATDAVSRTRSVSDSGSLATVADAERTLARLRERQTLDAAQDDALADMDAQEAPKTVAEKLAAAGCGPRVGATGADVLARLKARVAQSPAA
jgi:phage shock protein A